MQFELIYVELKTFEIYLNWAADPLLLLHIKVFLKNKKTSGTSLSALFSAWFLQKNTSLDQISLSVCLYVRYQAICYCYCLLTTLWPRKFWNQRSIVTVPGTVCTRQPTHTKTSHEYVIKKHWLKGLLSHFAHEV